MIIGSHLNHLALTNRQRLMHRLSGITRANLFDLNVLTISQVIVLRYSIVLLLVATTPVGDCGVSIRLGLTFQATVWMQRRVLNNRVIVDLLGHFVVPIIVGNP